ncbi:hypothetical protein D6817_02115 [Candidatus Pacearchaeota archaeon]|nr:MAG: hypothetical protein D6817_02115 [Candidatus Pacearchaeota archaeon]
MESETELIGVNEENRSKGKNLSDIIERVEWRCRLAIRGFVGTVVGTLGTFAAMTYNYDVAQPLYRELDALQQQRAVVEQDYRALQRTAEEAGLESEAVTRKRERLGEKLEAIEARASDIKRTIAEVESPPLFPTSVLGGLTALSFAVSIYSLWRIKREIESYRAQ